MDNEEYNEVFNYNYYNNNNKVKQISINNNFIYNKNPEEIYIKESNNNDNINQYNDFINIDLKNTQTSFSNNFINKINRIYNLLNLYENLSLYNQKNEKDKSNIRTNNIINLLLYVFSGFNIKLKESSNLNNIFSEKDILENNINKLNLILKYLNSKFILKNNLTSEEYILLTIYFIDYFDLFKNLIDFLKNNQNDTLFSWKNLYLSLNDNIIKNNLNEFNNMDNLKKMELFKSNTVLEAYNKLHFIISNIKKQIDTLVNQIFKLNEIKINQSLGRYKLEEILLIADNNIFEDYKQKILFSPDNNFINKYLENIIEAIKIYPDTYDILVKEFKNYNLSNIINNDYYPLNEEKSENNNKVNKMKLNFIQKLVELQYNLNNFEINNFKIFFNDLQNKINYNISEIKNQNNEIINNDEFSKMLNNVLMQLQNYINKNIIDLNNIIQCNSDIDTIIKDIFTAQKMFLANKNNNIWEKYSNYLFSIKEYLEMFYKKNMISINEIIQSKEDIINKDFHILNKKK